MRKSFQELRKILQDNNLPEFPSFIPGELKTTEMAPFLDDMFEYTLNEVAKDDSLSTLLIDYIGVARKANISTIEDLIKKLQVKKKSCCCEENEDLKPTFDGFKTAKGNEPQTIKKQKTEDESGNEDFIIERIKNEIIETKLNIQWDDVVGLDDVKKNINEIVLWPMQRPDIFTGLRGPPKGLMLFGPPGTGKTMIGKCIASQVKATFFSISASSLTSKWVGEGEKMVRALFYLARKMQPSVIFVDEIDSLLSQRVENETEGSRRIKTEFLVQFDGVGTNDSDLILLIGATNRPAEIDEAARRRLVKRVYVPLPEKKARIRMVENLLKEFTNSIESSDFDKIASLTEGYSGSDMFNLCREASLEPLREIGDIRSIDKDRTRPINYNDFLKATKQIRRSVSEKDLKGYVEWNEKFGSIC